MFFYPSKILWLVASPTNFLLLMTLLGLVLCWTKWAHVGRWLASLAVIVLLLAGFGPLGTWLARPLDDRFQRPVSMARPDGIIVLGGAIGGARHQISLNDSAERMTEALVLTRRFEGLPVIFTGGTARLTDIVPDGVAATEAEAAIAFFGALGLQAPQLVVEDKSRNTLENALFVRDLLPAKREGTYLLVTSGWHMPRSVGIFRKAGITVVPWPVDPVTTGSAHDLWRFNRTASHGLALTDQIVKEWVGLLVYYWMGYTDGLFPGPQGP